MNKIISEVKKGRDRHWKNFIDRDYLGSHNLEKNEDMVVTIAKVEPEESVKNHQTNKEGNQIVLYFVENVPKMIINITNATSIAQLYGNHIEDWEGKKIQLMTASVTAFGKTQDALRIRDVVPKGPMTIQEATTLLDKCKTLDDLKIAWTQQIPIVLRNSKALLENKDNLKDKLK